VSNEEGFVTGLAALCYDGSGGGGGGAHSLGAAAAAVPDVAVVFTIRRRLYVYRSSLRGCVLRVYHHELPLR
jgi:hypothetical protein